MKVKFEQEIPNKRWHELSYEIGEMLSNPDTRLCISRQPRTLPEATLKNEWAALQKEQDELEEYHMEPTIAEVMATVYTEGRCCFVLSLKDNSFRTIPVGDCTRQVEVKK